MPLPRSSDSGSSGAPVLNIPNARVRLFDVEEHVEPFVVTRKSDGAAFTLDPQFKCSVEILDDGGDGTNKGVTFYDAFRYKQGKEGQWVNEKNSKLGALTIVVKPNYFEDSSIPDLTEDDLEEFEIQCRIKPKKTPQGTVVGSMIDWETMLAVPSGAKEKVAAGEASATAEEDEDFDSIPF